MIKFICFLLVSFVVCFSFMGCACAEETDSTCFIFTGHIRGPKNLVINSLLPYFVADVQCVDKDFVVIGGDTICGYITAYDEDKLNAEWDMVDKYLNKIGVPIYRVLGNHDFHSELTKKVFNERYGSEYYSFVKNGIMFIVLNSVKICPDTSLDWGTIWTSDSHLPNETVLPSGNQLEFLKNNLNKAVMSPDVNNIVIFVGGLLWEAPETKARWWKEFHPLLVSSKKVKIVLSGEAGNDTRDVYLREDDILYLRNSWGITSEKEFSLGGTYLQVKFQKGKKTPEIYARFINLTPEYYQALMGAISADTERHLIEKTNLLRGERISSLNSMRMVVKDWINTNFRFYDRNNNVHMVLTVFGLGLALLVLIIKAFKRRRR